MIDGNRARASRTLMLVATLLLAGCNESSAPEPLLGTLEWDRIALPAEASEPVLSLAVAEGAQVKAGDLLLTLDGRRMQARIDQARAALGQQQALLSELIHGARIEELDAARAAVARAQASLVEATRQYARAVDLAQKQFVARSTLDAARATRDRASAELAETQAKLRELTEGTRSEQVAQAEAALANAQASLDELLLSQARLQVRATRAGRVDSLPFKAGDQPPLGASVVSLLVGEAPYARVFVPVSQRTRIREGQTFSVRVHGSDTEHPARLRSIAREPAFTPYFALTGDDASRLVYRAELVLTGAAARELPAGLPVQARIAK